MEILCRYDEMVQTEDLKPNPENPNKHNYAQLDKLAEIIKYYGWRHPIIVSEKTGMIVVGHGRYEAAKILKCEKCPVVYQSFADDDEEYSFMVADNGIGNWSELDLSMINLKLQDLGPSFDISLLGIKDFVIEPFEKYEDNEKLENVEIIGDISNSFYIIVQFENEEELNKFKSKYGLGKKNRTINYKELMQNEN